MLKLPALFALSIPICSSIDLFQFLSAFFDPRVVTERNKYFTAPQSCLSSLVSGLIPLKDDLSLYRGSVKLGSSEVELELRCTADGIKLQTDDVEFSAACRRLETESPEFFRKICSIKDPNRHLHELMSAIET